MIACLAVTSIMFSGCDKSNDPNVNGNIGGNASTITANNIINSSSEIATVKVVYSWITEYDIWETDVIDQTLYNENGFTLELPASGLDKYLYLLAEVAPSGINISDKTVKCGLFQDIVAYNSDDNSIGCFFLTDEEENGAVWAYVDKKVTIKENLKKLTYITNMTTI